MSIAAITWCDLALSADHASAEGLLLGQDLLEQIVPGVDLWGARSRPVVMVECRLVGAPPAQRVTGDNFPNKVGRYRELLPLGRIRLDCLRRSYAGFRSPRCFGLNMTISTALRASRFDMPYWFSLSACGACTAVTVVVSGDQP